MESREFDTAVEQARDMHVKLPQAVSARYDYRTRRIVVTLNTGIGVNFLPRLAEGLEDASPDDLQVIEISPSGFGIHFPRLDADIYLPALLAGSLGSERWMAEHTPGRLAQRKSSGLPKVADPAKHSPHKQPLRQRA